MNTVTLDNHIACTNYSRHAGVQVLKSSPNGFVQTAVYGRGVPNLGDGIWNTCGDPCYAHQLLLRLQLTW